MKRSEIKKRAKGAYYRNWKACIIVCFVYLVFVGGTIISFSSEQSHNNGIKVVNINSLKAGGKSNSEIVNEFINGITGNEPRDSFISSTSGVIAPLINNISKTGSYLFGFLNAVNQFLFRDRIVPSVVIIIGALLSLVYWVFVSKVLEVGQARFFLENRKYTKTKPNKLLLVYRINKTGNVSYTMFLKNVYNILWYFTIIGGVVKSYQYAMVPYILAENPNMKAKDVIKLSKDMMDGYKWELFKLDLSFILWGILGVITFNISNIIYTNPVMRASKAEVYMYLRDISKTKYVDNADLLSDGNLEGEIVFEEYPVYEYILKEGKSKRWLNFNYNRDYSLSTLIILFFIFSSIGYIWEVLLYLFETGILVNRGTLYGPWLPIYGSGGVIMLVLLKKYRKNPFAYFCLAMVVAGIIEYATSVYLEVVHHMSWWDYTGFFLNLNGRICLEGLLLFGIGGVIVTYIAAPFFAMLLDKVNKRFKTILCIILVVLIAGDFYISGKKPNSGEGVSSDILKSSKIEKYREVK